MAIHPMHGPNKFKLGVFSMNSDGGLTLTKVPERWPAIWSEIVEVSQLADRAGIEFLLPIARWKGFGGEMNSREWSFETLTHAAALGAATKNIAVFATVHVPMVHPVFAAKALATVDHVSNGRAGLNIVCGWNPGRVRHVRARADRGTLRAGARVVRDHESHLHGGCAVRLRRQVLQAEGRVGKPRPVQQPRPITLNAAFSPPGREFAAKAADCLFTTFTEIDKGREHIDDMKKRAAAEGREVGVYTTCHVVCRPTQAEAEAYYEHYAVTMADSASLDHYVKQKQTFSGSHDADAYRLHRKRFAAGAGTYPLVGTPAFIAEEMVKIARAGFAGTTVSFVNFKNELPYFIDNVLPLLKEAGLRA